MTIWVETDHSFVLADQARLLDDSKEVAWAEKHIVPNPANGWVLGKYVEADNANSNRQYFNLDGLRMAKPTISHAPMNINHNPRRIVGAYVAAELVWPTNGESDELAAGMKPYVEALGVVWRAVFPEEYKTIQAAQDTGNLFYSMECVPSHLECAGGDMACGQVFPYAGPVSPTYCAHLNNPYQFDTVKSLMNPHFTGGALIVPPEKPGWKNASASQIAGLVKDQLVAAQEPQDGLDPKQWESLMAELITITQ